MKNSFVFILVLFLPLVLFGAEKNDFAAKIESDVNLGILSKADAAILQLQALKEPQSLPQTYQEIAPSLTRNGTALIAEIKGSLSEYSAKDRARIETYLMRPSKTQLPESLVSPRGLFRIHYTTEGNDTADPDFVAHVAEYFDYSYGVEVEQLGYDPPPMDDDEHGPEWDVYMHNISDYGYTTYDNPVLTTSWDDYTGFIEMDNNFTHTPTLGLDAAKVTAAHEFFHLIHLGYRSYNTPKLNSVFLYEMCAAWMEDVVYDEINDYYYYLNKFFGNYSKPFNTKDGGHEYGLALFCHMLEKKYGRGAVRTIWEKFRTYETFDALEETMKTYNSSLSQELTDFAIWNVFTGERADTTLFYPEGMNYPEIEPSQKLSFSKTITFTGENKNLACDYILLEPEASGDYSVWPDFDDPFNSMYGIVLLTDEGPSIFEYGAGNSLKELSGVNSLSQIWIIPVNTTIPTSDYSVNKKNFQFTVAQGKAPIQEDKLVSVVPNPFNLSEESKVEFRFKLSEPSEKVIISVLSEHGVVIKRENIGKRPDGDNKYTWNGMDANNQTVASGVYLYLIETDHFFKPGKFAIIR